MEYAEFDTERRRIIGAWGNEITDPEELRAAADSLREQAAAIQDHTARTKALRHHHRRPEPLSPRRLTSGGR